jgi:copper(I)-binding protein
MIRAMAIAVTCFAVSLALPAQAQDVTAGPLKISAPWARATPKGATIGGGYMKSMDNGVMKMRPMAKGLEVQPGQTVEFKPSGYHVMFVGLKKQLMQGEHFKATLQFEKAGKVDVDFTVEGIGAKSAPAMPGMDMKH